MTLRATHERRGPGVRPLALVSLLAAAAIATVAAAVGTAHPPDVTEAATVDAAETAHPVDPAGEPAAGASAPTSTPARAGEPEVLEDAPEPETVAPSPTRLHVPALGVDADLIDLHKRADETLEVPEDAHVPGWWAGGHAPGEGGPAVVVGHVDSYEGPGIFYGLEGLESGDLVTIDREDGTSATFAVQRTEWHRKDRFPTEAVYGPTEGPELRLVTCGGEFDRDARSYEENVVVFLELVDRS